MMIEKSRWTKTTCAYCGVGCGIEAKVDAQGKLEIRGDKVHPANYGALCSKGLALGETVGHQGRMMHPNIDGIDTDWPTALNHVATQLSETIKKYGPDSVAFYASGQLLTEDYYVANKLMKGFIGSGNIDTNSRLCMSSSVVGHKRAFGSDTVPICYQDLESAELVIITGSNLAWCHPVLFQRLKEAKQQRPELFIVVIDPRKTDTCAIADLHLAIQPGTDVALFNGLLAYLAHQKKTNIDYIKHHTQGFNLTLESAINDTRDQQALIKKLKISKPLLQRFYKKFADTEKVVTIYSQGVNQSSQGSDKVNSILNCHLATGRIGKEGMGPFSVTGQPNAMGGREVGGLANTLAAHMEFGNTADHHLISDFWKTKNLATSPGLKAIDLFDAIDDGKIKAIWIMATNPAVSLPNSNKVIRALKKCPLVVVSDCIKDTATVRLANVLLPAQGWSEKSGTVTNSERRISRQRRLLPTPGEGKADWWIISEVAKRMGFQHAFSYLHEGEIFSEYAQMTTLGNEDGKKRDLNLIGLTKLDAQGYGELKPQQWPVKKLQNTIIHQRMFSDNKFFTDSKKAQFIAVKHQELQDTCSESYPLLLNSGRIRDHWHTMTRTGLSSRLSAHIAEPFLTVNSIEAKNRFLKQGDLVTVSSRNGYALVRVSISDNMSRKQVFMPIHWNQANAKKATVCALISGYTDPNSGQPEFKATPVNIEKWDFQSEALFLSRTEFELSEFAYWAKQKVTDGFLYRIADKMPAIKLKSKLLALINAYSNKKMSKELHYSNTDDNPIYRYANIQAQHVAYAYIVAANLQQQSLDWMQHLLDIKPDVSFERSIISGQMEGKLAQGKIVCACKQVGENTLNKAIQTQTCPTIENMGKCTGAGTGCGSCIPDIEQLIEAHAVSFSLA